MTKKVTLTFYVNELFSDIENICFTEGYVMSDEAEPSKHLTIDVLDTRNRELVVRYMDLAAGEIGVWLRKYIKTPVEDNFSGDDKYEEPTEYVYNMEVPEDFKQTSVNYLIELIHNYIIWRVLYYWLMRTNLDAAQRYLALAEDSKEKIKSAIANLFGRARIKQTPF